MPIHRFESIAPHVYWLSPDAATDRPILGAVAGTRGTLLVDAGNSPAHAHILLGKLSERALPAPTFVALTHWHWDHVFGTTVLELPTLAHVETRRIVTVMAHLDWSDAALDRRVAEGKEIAFCRDNIKAELPDRTDLRIRPPDIGFTAEVELDLGGVMCRVMHVGGDHSPDSSIVYVPEDRIMFLGDCLSSDIYHGAGRHTTAALFPLLDRLLEPDVDYYLVAHSPEPWSRAELAGEAELLKTIGRVVESHPQDREGILSMLPDMLQAPVNADHVEIVDAFLAGLKTPAVESVL